MQQKQDIRLKNHGRFSVFDDLDMQMQEVDVKNIEWMVDMTYWWTELFKVVKWITQINDKL